jgi:hypothetical protein
MLMMISGVETDPDTFMPEYTSQYYAGAMIMFLFEFFIPAGITTSIMGKNKMNNAIYQYNQNSFDMTQKPKATFHLGLTSNGVGMRLVF